MQRELASELLDFIYKSPSAFHAVKTVKDILLSNNYTELKEEEKWNLEPNKSYYVTRNGTALIAFKTGREKPQEKGFKLIGAHTDSPGFRIKPNPEIVSEGTYLKLNTEVYGGPILSTWMDRPLGIAGRVTLKGENPLYPVNKLINIARPLVIIPNLAIHMNREVSKGVELNRQKDTLPLISLINDSLEKNNYLLNILSRELEINSDEIIDFDLFLYEFQKGCFVGENEEFISSSRLDDLSMVHAGIKALINSKDTEGTQVMVCFDNEEVGSSTKQGADSQLLANILERIVISFGGGREDFFRALSRSFMISADLAHAVHPNSGDKHDPTNRPVINKGPVIKVSANQKYTTDSDSSAVYELICKNAGIPVQKFVNRSDMAGGSTIGPISSTHLDIRSVDMGTPIFAMHSVRELGGIMDHYYVLKSFEEFYNL
ncbi:M18 family aminopeptidase [Clostridium polynesiense]|uniref:M18 family aminopeptidase n=1 Tax=Clostridium polynesiense TaxID=1325933 RepID=UPI00058E77C8|nr:M18 family aminopeptidase [Clostridium polynesiense]